MQVCLLWLFLPKLHCAQNDAQKIRQKVKIKMNRRFIHHLEDAGHIPSEFSRAEWEDLAYR